jgi:hypothetical protein
MTYGDPAIPIITDAGLMLYGTSNAYTGAEPCCANQCGETLISHVMCFLDKLLLLLLLPSVAAVTLGGWRSNGRDIFTAPVSLFLWDFAHHD